MSISNSFSHPASCPFVHNLPLRFYIPRVETYPCTPRPFEFISETEGFKTPTPFRPTPAPVLRLSPPLRRLCWNHEVTQFLVDQRNIFPHATDGDCQPLARIVSNLSPLCFGRLAGSAATTARPEGSMLKSLGECGAAVSGPGPTVNSKAMLPVPHVSRRTPNLASVVTQQKGYRWVRRSIHRESSSAFPRRRLGTV